jgi:hypothetical protein
LGGGGLSQQRIQVGLIGHREPSGCTILKVSIC